MDRLAEWPLTLLSHDLDLCRALSPGLLLDGMHQLSHRDTELWYRIGVVWYIQFSFTQKKEKSSQKVLGGTNIEVTTKCWKMLRIQNSVYKTDKFLILKNCKIIYYQKP